MIKSMNTLKKIMIGGTIVCTMATCFSVINPINHATTTTVYAASNIGKTKAKSIALKHADLKSSDVTFTKAKLDSDDGKTIYEIEFYKDNQEYDYDIDAKSGQILKYDYENNEPQKSTSKSAKNIGKTKAKSIALAHAGLKSSDVTFTKTKLDSDDGVSTYEVEFYKDNQEYDYTIHAKTGIILDYSYEIDDTKKTTSTSTTQKMSKTKAKSIALAHAGLKESSVDYIKVELDKDDGVSIYEVEFYKDNIEYKYEISAKTGKILEWDKDYDD